MSKHIDKWLNYENDGRDEPGVKLRIAMRYIELMGGFENAITILHNHGKDTE